MMVIRRDDIDELQASDLEAGELVPVTHPGEHLNEVLTDLGITQYRLAKDIGVGQRRIGEIIQGQRAITADTALRIAHYLNMSPGYWMGLQAAYDLDKARQALGDQLQRMPQHAA